jgi:hypothetical protein
LIRAHENNLKDVSFEIPQRRLRDVDVDIPFEVRAARAATDPTLRTRVEIT